MAWDILNIEDGGKAILANVPKVLGAKDLKTLVDHTVAATLQELDKRLDQRLAEVENRASRLSNEILAEVEARAGRISKEVLSEARKNLAGVLGQEVSNLVGQTRREADMLAKNILAEMDSRIGEIDARAARLANGILEEARRNLASVLEQEVALLVTQTRAQADDLVKVSLDRVEGTARTLVDQLSAALSRQQTEVRINAADIIGQAGAQIEPLSRREPPRFCRRPHKLRGWGHERDETEVFT